MRRYGQSDLSMIFHRKAPFWDCQNNLMHKYKYRSFNDKNVPIVFLKLNNKSWFNIRMQMVSNSLTANWGLII